MSRALLARCSSNPRRALTAAAAAAAALPRRPKGGGGGRGAGPLAAMASAASAPPPNDPSPLAEAKARARDAAKARLRAMTREAMADESAAVAALVAASRPFRAAAALGLYATCARLREVDTSAVLDAALAQGKRVHLPLVLDRRGGMALLHVPLGRRDLRAGAPPFGIAEPRSRGYLVPAAPAAAAAAAAAAADGRGGAELLVEGPEPRANALPEPDDGDDEHGGAAGPPAAAAAAAAAPPLAPLDLLLVPGFAFDRQGRRLGRGGGYYDRAIAALRRAWPERPPLLVALAFRAQVVEEEEEEEGSAAPSPLPADDATDARVDVLATPDGLVACTARGREALEAGGG